MVFCEAGQTLFASFTWEKKSIVRLISQFFTDRLFPWMQAHKPPGFGFSEGFGLERSSSVKQNYAFCFLFWKEKNYQQIVLGCFVEDRGRKEIKNPIKLNTIHATWDVVETVVII
jgi:hypothetical protein